jgi:protoporphyrinogen oxidase
LIRLGISKNDLLVLEKEIDPGGLCKSQIVDGAPLDTGGGHFLDVKNQIALKFLNEFMPDDEWNHFHRVSKINHPEGVIDYPIESNLWQLPTKIQRQYIQSIAIAGATTGSEAPKSFRDWIKWKLGDKIANDYMIPYNEKIWSINLEDLGTYWLHKLPNVSLDETILSCSKKIPLGKLPAHQEFLYPKHYGYGEVWRRMGEALNSSLITDFQIKNIDIDAMTVNNNIKAEKIITTIPWNFWPEYSNLPEIIKIHIAELKKAEIDVQYYPENISSNAHWIYDPDKNTSYHRQLLRPNFYIGAKGHWTETNSKRSSKNEPKKNFFHNEYAYPINTINKPKSIDLILNWFHGKGIIGLGRWGKWEHINSDIAVSNAINLANTLVQ